MLKMAKKITVDTKQEFIRIDLMIFGENFKSKISTRMQTSKRIRTKTLHTNRTVNVTKEKY